jgi:hypothetical protein
MKPRIHNQLTFLAPDELPPVDLLPGEETLSQIIEFYTVLLRRN